MKIHVNDKEYNFDSSTLTVSGLLGKLNMSSAGVIVELNGDVFSSKDFHNTNIPDGSKIELIRIVGGG